MRLFSKFLIIGLLFGVLFHMGAGCIFDPEIQGQVQAFQYDAEQLGNEAAHAIQKAQETKQKIDDITTKLKTGKINAKLGAETLAILNPEWAEWRVRAATLKSKSEGVYQKAEDLHTRHGVPWWQIAGVGALSLLTGGGAVQRVMGSRYTTAVNGIKILAGALETASDQSKPADTPAKLVSLATVKAAKVQIAKAQNPAVEKVVQEMNEAKAKAT